MGLRLDLILCGSDTNESIRRDCNEAGWEVSRFLSIGDFLRSPDTSPVPLVILSISEDWKDTKPGSQLSSLKDWHKNNPDTQIILFTPENFAGADRLAIRLGARHSLFFPYRNRDLIGILSKIAQGIGKRQQIKAVNKHLIHPDGFEEIIGESDKIQEVIKLAMKVGKSEFTSVMITGESGTGKGALARAIHQIGSRASGPFIEVNCAAIPRNLLESEFFGYEKGAFTDAKERKRGLFEIANGGTIFLDEIGEIDYGLQAKLLKFLDSRTIRRVSGTQFLPVDVQIISSTNKNLKEAIASNNFRTDLFYRLNVIEITLPPLRDRIEDIRPIALSYTRKFAARLKKEDIRLTEEACQLLEQYSWPGNIRELINLIERAVLLDDDGVITAEDLPVEKNARETAVNIRKTDVIIKIDLPPEGASLESVERGLIVATLEHTGGNITRAARLLKVERGTLRYKMKKHGIEATDHKKKIKIGEYEPVPVTT